MVRLRVPVPASAALLAGGALLLGVACVNAPDSEAGGTLRFDNSSDAACAPPDTDAGSGDNWGALYRDYFGTTGKASCAGTAGACHGDATSLGAENSNFVCGTTVGDCYTGITSTSVGIVTVGDTTDDPKNSGLYAVLRKTCGGGAMPKEPATVTFTPGDMARIAGWIGAGSPNN